MCTTLSTSCEFGIQCEGFCWLCKKFVCSICTCMWPSLKISHSRVCFLCMLSMCGLLAYQYSTSLVSQVNLQGRLSNWDEDWLIRRGKTLLGIVIRIQRQFPFYTSLSKLSTYQYINLRGTGKVGIGDYFLILRDHYFSYSSVIMNKYSDRNIMFPFSISFYSYEYLFFPFVDRIVPLYIDWLSMTINSILPKFQVCYCVTT